MRIEQILQNRKHATGETWRIIENDGTFKVQTVRLGTHEFTDRRDMDSFIAENHKGAPKNGVGIIHRKII